MNPSPLSPATLDSQIDVMQAKLIQANQQHFLMDLEPGIFSDPQVPEDVTNG